MRSRLGRGASRGITMTAGMPNSFAAAATPWAWLPEENATTPPPRSSGAIARELVVGAAELERAGPLQRLRLEEDPAARERIEHRRSDQRRAQRDAGEPPGGDIHVGRGGQRRRLNPEHWPCATVAPQASRPQGSKGRPVRRIRRTSSPAFHRDRVTPRSRGARRRSCGSPCGSGRWTGTGRG